MVDNTFATPYLQTPRDLGADITVNSGTKYLGGHSDVIFGCLTCSDKELYDRLFFSAKSIGGCPSIFDCWLVQRSIKTLEVRVKQAVRNAYIFAKYLESNPLVEKVIYPGLPSHPQHALVKQQMRGSGAMISFYVKGGFEETSRLLKALKIFTLGESLGGVESKSGNNGRLDRDSLGDDPRFGAARAEKDFGNHGQPGADIGGHREHRGPDRGHGERPEGLSGEVMYQ